MQRSAGENAEEGVAVHCSSMDPLKIYDYLTIARGRLMDAAKILAPEQYLKPFKFGLKSVASTLTHLMISEWYYMERFTGRAVPPYEEWPIKYESPPAFDVVERTWRGQATDVRATLAGERDWGRTITWLSFPNDEGTRFHIVVTPGDLFTQLALHEAHHRSQAMVMLRELGHPLSDLDYNALMFERRPAV
jgi:uncharacterized damage-inducible protein DinB